MSKDLIKTIDGIQSSDELTDSQKDRLTNPQTALIEFLTSHLKRAGAKNALKEAIEEEFTREMEEGTLSTSVKLKLFELLLSKESNSEATTLNVIAKMLEAKTKKDETPTGNQSAKPESGVDQQTLKQGQEALEFINKLKNSEFGSFLENKNPKE